MKLLRLFRGKSGRLTIFGRALNLLWAVSAVADNRTPVEMVGEFMREAAVLVAVFLPLDAYVNRTYVNRTLTIDKFAFTVVLSASVLAIGIWLEVARR